MSKAFAWFFLSMRGHISRQEYWLGFVGLTVSFIALSALLEPVFLDWLRPAGRIWDRDELRAALAMPRILLAIGLMWPMASLYVKRLHDLNLPGWWVAAPCFLLLASMLNFDHLHFAFWTFVIGIGFVPGTHGGNDGDI